MTLLFDILLPPLSAAGEERDVERSDDRVSRLPPDNLNYIQFYSL
jgi:hypothetical protein